MEKLEKRGFEFHIHHWPNGYDLYSLLILYLYLYELHLSVALSMCVSCSVVSDSLRHHGLWPARLPQPWDFPGKNAGVGCRKISFSRRSSQSRDWTWVSCTEGRLFTVWATREAWRKAAFNSLPKRVMLSLDQITRDNHFSALVKHRHTNVECLFVKTTSGKNRMSLIHICLKLSPLSHQLYQVVVQG